MRETGTISSPFFTELGISARSLALSSGMRTFLIPPLSAASSFSLRPPIGRTRPRSVISPVMAMSRRTGMPVSIETMTVAMPTPAEGPSFGVAPVEQRRLDAEVDGARAYVGRRSRNRLLHHVLEIARHRHAALAGHHDALDRQEFAADLRPGETSHQPDLIVGLDFAIAELRRAEELGDVLAGDDDRFALVDEDLLHRLAREIGNFTLEIADASLPRIAPDKLHDGAVLDDPFLGFETVLGH